MLISHLRGGKMKKFIALGGDGRTEFMAQHLREKGFNTEILYDINKISSCEAFILPLPFTEDNINIKGTNINIKNFIESINNNAVIFAGKLNNEIEMIFKNKEIVFYDYNTREEFAQKNAVPTAQGVLTFVLNNTNVTLNLLKIAVIGYGKCGKAICKSFKKQGADVLSYSRRYSTAADAESDGLKAFLIKDINETIKDVDIIVNTVPVKIIDENILDSLNINTMIIDISSYPYGFDYNYAKKINRKINLLPSMPGKYVPKSAGIIIAETIINIIEEGGLWKE